MVNVVGLFIDHCIISDQISVFVKLMLCLLCMKISCKVKKYCIPSIKKQYLFHVSLLRSWPYCHNRPT